MYLSQCVCQGPLLPLSVGRAPDAFVHCEGFSVEWDMHTSGILIGTSLCMLWDLRSGLSRDGNCVSVVLGWWDFARMFNNIDLRACNIMVKLLDDYDTE
jgi:hypothetical protein